VSFLGIDVGTTGTKAVLLGEKGAVLASAVEPHTVSTPRPLWSEQDPEEWWGSTCHAVSRVLAQAVPGALPVSGIGLSGQMVGLVALDDKGLPLRPCILWNDQRSSAEADEVTARIGLDRILAETGNPLFASFVAPKLLWLRGHEPEIYRKIRHVVLPKDYVRYRLTGELATEVSDASGTCVFNVRDRAWSATMLGAMDLPPEWFPRCAESQEIAGGVSVKAAADTGLAAGIPVIFGGGDQPIQALGCGIVRPGRCLVTIGTSGVVFAQADTYFQHPEGVLHAFCHALPGQWYLMGVMLSAGGSLRWLRDTLFQPDPASYDSMTEEAATAPAGSESLVFLPYLTGERVPHSDPKARGCWIGLTPRHGRAHLIRSVMEGISFGLLDSLNLMRALGTPISSVFASGGGARSSVWRQMLADIFGVEVLATSSDEGAAYGAAMLAAVGTGEFDNAAQAADAMIAVGEACEPDAHATGTYRDLYSVYRSLYPALKGSFVSLSALS
jgi:xylulokinase